MYGELKELEKKFEIKEFPLNVIVEVGNYCNLKCTTCCNSKIKRPRGYMNMNLYRKIINEVAQVNPYARVWLDFYGEPLLVRYQLYYMIDYAKKKGLKNVNINTNGTLMNEEMAEMLLDSGIDFISIDCDGFSKEVYEKIRIGADRDVTYKNIEYILKRRKERGQSYPIIEVKAMEMEENKHELEQIISYWRERGAWTTLRRLITWGGALEGITHDNVENRIACGSGLGIFCVTWDGKVPTCVSDVDLENCMGDVNKESISEIWKRRNESFVKKHMEHKWDELPDICKHCTDWTIVGEKRFDENGNEINKNYSHEGKMLTSE